MNFINAQRILPQYEILSAPAMVIDEVTAVKYLIFNIKDGSIYRAFYNIHSGYFDVKPILQNNKTLDSPALICNYSGTKFALAFKGIDNYIYTSNTNSFPPYDNWNLASKVPNSIAKTAPSLCISFSSIPVFNPNYIYLAWVDTNSNINLSRTRTDGEFNFSPFVTLFQASSAFRPTIGIISASNPFQYETLCVAYVDQNKKIRFYASTILPF